MSTLPDTSGYAPQSGDQVDIRIANAVGIPIDMPGLTVTPARCGLCHRPASAGHKRDCPAEIDQAASAAELAEAVERLIERLRDGERIEYDDTNWIDRSEGDPWAAIVDDAVAEALRLRLVHRVGGHGANRDQAPPHLVLNRATRTADICHHCGQTCSCGGAA